MFPDPSQIELTGSLAVDARQIEFLDIAVAAQDLHRLRSECRRAFADPELRGRRDDAAEVRRRITLIIVGASQPHRQHGRGFGLNRKIGEHVRHQRVLDEPLLKSPAVPGMMNGLRHGLPHERRRSDGAIEPRVVAHFDDRRNSAAFFTQ